ncbi:hypothetical protein ABGB09_29760 [Streptomyces sp. B8F3]|uniref:hypothetical protein n=1 Tax=Streptomyces sp. B8F3 TaxID=3153573 RepID=UPI00325C4320
MIRRTDAERARRAALADAAAGILTVRPEAPPAPARPLMTLRVSRDSGRTWEPEQRFYSRDCTVPLIDCTPPCECARCRREP